MKGASLLLLGILAVAPIGANAQALIFGNSAGTAAYANGQFDSTSRVFPSTPEMNFRFTATDPNDQFLPQEYRDRGDGYELRSALEAALSKTLDGVIEYRWNEGEDPTLAIAGVPAEMKIRKSTVMLGLSYRH